MRETGTNPQAPDGPADNDRTTPPEAPQPTEAGESGAEQPALQPQDRPAPEPRAIPDREPDRPQAINASDELERRVSGNGLPADDDTRAGGFGEEALEQGMSDRLKRIAAKLDRNDEPEELAGTVDHPDFRDPHEDPEYVPDR